MNFKKSLIFVLIGIFVIVFSTTYSNAQGPRGHRKGGKKGCMSHEPSEWHKGETKGWGGRDVPPGLEKGEERARERELQAEGEEREAVGRGRSEEAKEMAITKGKKGGKGKGKEKGKAWWKFWRR